MTWKLCLHFISGQWPVVTILTWQLLPPGSGLCLLPPWWRADVASWLAISAPPLSQATDARASPPFMSFLVKAVPWAQILTFTVWSQSPDEQAEVWIRAGLEQMSKSISASLLHLHQEPGLDPGWSLQCLRLFYGSGRHNLLTKSY